MYFMPGCYLFALFDLNRRFLIVFKVTIVPMILIVTFSALHFLICYLMVDIWDSILTGLGVASSILCLELFVATKLCLNLHQETKVAQVWPDCALMKDSKEYLKLALPLAAIFLCECAAWSGLTIFAGYLSVED